MSEDTQKIESLIIRPIDCSKQLIERFAELVTGGDEVPLDNLQRGLPSSEVLIITRLKETEKIVGVGALRFAQAAYHKHLFANAGVSEMYNPYSVESCWVAVDPEYRGKGVWRSNRNARLSYLGNRPCHSTRRVDNKLVGGDREWSQAGKNFYSQTSEDELRLLVYNHDPVFDKSKRLQYV